MEMMCFESEMYEGKERKTVLRMSFNITKVTSLFSFYDDTLHTLYLLWIKIG